ncbi:hypothetical protein GRI89_16310 [Altererythrobacter salegens]|uniref:Uncharacterized protein n=1 Tax=Croceibacterium salegens TaxID=1737568 RepID=A0A6I4T1G4_9SPHN|nr:hypothetical protein [Croceibacterium salegens]MXO61107.1 hypothetical protein [Croceibacterium salegens]
MISLAELLSLIEAREGIAFEDLAGRIAWGRDELWTVAEFANSEIGSQWSAVDVSDGSITAGVAFEVHNSWNWDVVYFLSVNRDSLFLILGEAASGIMFFKVGQPPVQFGKDRGTLLSEYQAEMDWVKLGERNAEWTALVYQWKALADVSVR